jgi:Raf kinase inhibitor-like YbhB/YbcL family protein
MNDQIHRGGPSMLLLAVIGFVMLVSCAESGPDETPGASDPGQSDTPGAPATSTAGAALSAGSEPFTLRSDAYQDGAEIPVRYTCDGEDISPALEWIDATGEIGSFALILEDPDAPGGTWTHWILFNLPPGTTALQEDHATTDGLPEGTSQGANSWGRSEYGAPCPPGGIHRYIFTIYALDRMLELPGGAERGQLLDAMEGHIIAEASLLGTYAR